MKRIISLVLALMLVFSLAITAFAAETGSIIVNNVVEGQTYAVYKLLDLAKYDFEKDAYLYTVNSTWTDFFETDDAKAYIAEDSENPGYVTWIKANENETEEESEERAAGLAKLALDYAKDNNITAIKTSNAVAEDKESVVFAKLELGYYLVDSSLGALCGLTTTRPTATVNEKNAPPTMDKKVKEDDGGSYGSNNNAGIGDTVTFQITVHAKKGAQNYVVHDSMSGGLDFVSVSSVKAGETDLTGNTNYKVVTSNLSDSCDFHVEFVQTYLDTITADTDIVIEYTATLNKDAVISGTANTNEAYLAYGDNQKTTEVTTNTYTFEFDLVKTDSNSKLLDGAQFKLYDAQNGGNEIKVVQENDGSYRLATKDDTTTVEYIEVSNGMVTISGLDTGTYYLEETVAPAGYNKITERKVVTISDSNLDATVNGDTYTSGGVQVVNKTGAVLPETGATGTMMFITFGVVVMLAAGVLLVTKKRMSMIRE